MWQLYDNYIVQDRRVDRIGMSLQSYWGIIELKKEEQTSRQGQGYAVKAGSTEKCEMG